MVRNFDVSLSHYRRSSAATSTSVRLSTAQRLAECFGVMPSALMRGL
jgi:hypothetical protein